MSCASKGAMRLNTAHPQYQEDLMSWGADACVVKSGDLTDLKNKIRELLGKSP